MQLSLRILILSFFVNCSYAQVVIWDGDTDPNGDGETWEKPENWNTNQVPNENSIVQITGDSVIVKSKVTISRLELLANAILVQQSPGPDHPVFNITQASGEGITIDGGAKLYVEGEFVINQVTNNGILIEANGSLLIAPSANLKIKEIGVDGIKSIPGATFVNEGNLLIEDYDGTGIDLTSFYNSGIITVMTGGNKAAVISASSAVNEGLIETYNDVEITSSLLFTNLGSSSKIKSHRSLAISCDFLNEGTIECLNSFGTSLFLSTNKTLTNNSQIKLKIATEDLVKMDGSFELLNTKDGSIYLTHLYLGAIPGVYIFDMLGTETTITNRGLINLQCSGRREGIRQGARTEIRNHGQFYVEDYIEKGIVTESVTLHTNTIMNLDTALFVVGKGMVPNATALTFLQRNDLVNDPCADFIVGDSISFTGTSTQLKNFGFMELERIYKSSQAEILNEGAMYLADSSLAINSDQSYIDQVDNTGLLYHPLEQPIVPGVPIQPFFREVDFSEVDIIGSQLYVSSGSGWLIPAGMINETNNSWIPPAAAADKDSVFFFYQIPGDPCMYRDLAIPFLNFDPCANATTLIFDGSSSTDWHTASNWTPAQVPSYCDEVIIPDGTHCVIGMSAIGAARLITVEEGAIFETSHDAELTVEPE